MFLSLQETNDFAEIRELTDEMLHISGNLFDTGELSKQMRKSDIDFNKATKIYMDRKNSLLGLNSDDTEARLSYLDTAEYIWEIQVDVGSQTVTYTLNIGKGVNPDTADLLTEEQIEYVNDQEDKWHIVRTSWGTQRGVDYKSFIKQQVNEKARSSSSTYIVIGGMPEVNYPLALEISNNRMESVIPACEEAVSSIEQVFSSEDNRSTLALTDVITFDELKQAVAN